MAGPSRGGFGGFKRTTPLPEEVRFLTFGAHARSEGYCSCLVCVCVCVYVCVSVRSFLPPRASRPRNIGTYMFHRDTENTFIIVIFAKNISFRSYGVICLPRMPLTTPEPQMRIPTESTQRGHDITIRDFN